MHCLQRAVWRKRGSNSPESLCKFASFAPVRAAVEAAAAPSRHHVIGKRTSARWKQVETTEFYAYLTMLEKFVARKFDNAVDSKAR